jgi:hypothetical protein
MLKIILVTLFLSSTAQAYVDLQVGFSYSTRRIEASNADGEIDPDLGEAQSTTKGFNVNWAWYIWETTALELNYAESEERIEDSRSTTANGGAITIKNTDSKVKTITQGVGIRQALASRKSTFIPSISIGYARYITSGETTYLLSDAVGDFEATIERDEETINSSYASVSLAIKITKLMRLALTARAIVPGVEIDKADQNITYSGGLSWIF